MDDLRAQIIAIHRRTDLSSAEKQTLTNELYAKNALTKTEKLIQAEDEQSIKDCKHYKRFCDIQCFKCSRWFGCRLCHDEYIQDHLIDHFAFVKLICE